MLKRVVILFVSLAVAACGGSDQEEEVRGNPLGVHLDEWSVTADRPHVPAGAIRFTAVNGGTQVHSFAVIRTLHEPDAIPVEDGNIVVVPDQVEVVGTIPDLPPETVESATVDLSPGRYVLICSVPGHYTSGMHTALGVV